MPEPRIDIAGPWSLVGVTHPRSGRPIAYGVGADGTPVRVCTTWDSPEGREVAELIAAEHNELRRLRGFEDAVRAATSRDDLALTFIRVVAALDTLDATRGGERRD